MNSSLTIYSHTFSDLYECPYPCDVSATKSFYTGSDRIDKGHIFVLGKPLAIHEPYWFVEEAAGMRSTASDMAHWLSLPLAHGRVNKTQLLSQLSITLMHTPPKC